MCSRVGTDNLVQLLLWEFLSGCVHWGTFVQGRAFPCSVGQLWVARNSTWLPLVFLQNQVSQALEETWEDQEVVSWISGVLLESALHSAGLSFSFWLPGPAHKGPMSSLHRLNCDLITSERGVASVQLLILTWGQPGAPSSASWACYGGGSVPQAYLAGSYEHWLPWSETLGAKLVEGVAQGPWPPQWSAAYGTVSVSGGQGPERLPGASLVQVPGGGWKPWQRKVVTGWGNTFKVGRFQGEVC